LAILFLIIKKEMALQALLSQQHRALGRTRVQLSLLGFGAAPIGNLYQAMTDETAEETVVKALDTGIGYFDTAPHYGFGLSETRLGLALGKCRNTRKPQISTKVGRLLVPTNSTVGLRHGFAQAPALEPVFDYTYDGVMRSFESSLERLQVGHIDLLLAHDLGVVTHGDEHPGCFREFMEGGYRAMHELRASGVVSAIGLGANEWQICEQALAHGDFDGFLLAGRYTLLEQGACESFLPLCKERGVSVILGGPFNSGILASGVSGNSPVYYNYEPAPPGIIERVHELELVCKEFDVSLAAAALQFPAAHPQICSVIAGLANAEQVEQAVNLMNSAIPADFWLALRELGLIHHTAPIPVPTSTAAEIFSPQQKVGTPL
jgi:D-threo-aldose 1-dehydrogenase